MIQDMNQRGVSLLVVDMRYNGGGNSLLGNMLLEALNIHLSISISHKLWKYNKHEESTWLYGRKGLGMRIRSFNDKSDFKILKHQ